VRLITSPYGPLLTKSKGMPLNTGVHRYSILMDETFLSYSSEQETRRKSHNRNVVSTAALSGQTKCQFP
jgi:hypothetical protein